MTIAATALAPPTPSTASELHLDVTPGEREIVDMLLSTPTFYCEKVKYTCTTTGDLTDLHAVRSRFRDLRLWIKPRIRGFGLTVLEEPTLKCLLGLHYLMDVIRTGRPSYQAVLIGKSHLDDFATSTAEFEQSFLSPFVPPCVLDASPPL